MSKWIDLSLLLSKQRNFILINGERSIGKTYTTMKWVFNRCMKDYTEFVYITRTQDEKNHGALEKGFKKVLLNEYPSVDTDCSNEYMWRLEPETNTKTLVGYCIALSEAVKIKKNAYPKVKYIIFDEYMLEMKQGKGTQYYNGWDEPNSLLSIYHTIDREEDRVIVFMLGNNTSFYNPYHMHPAFNIPHVEKGKMWMSENVLFYWATASEELQEQKAQSKFLRMLNGSSYGKYAKDGDYIDDNYAMVQELTTTARYIMTFEYANEKFGVYSDLKNGLAFISDKADASCKTIFALTVDDHNENTMIAHTREFSQLNWLARNFKIGNVRFVSMEVKMKIEKGLVKIL